jgi:hypothetical protein
MADGRIAREMQDTQIAPRVKRSQPSARRLNDQLGVTPACPESTEVRHAIELLVCSLEVP